MTFIEKLKTGAKEFGIALSSQQQHTMLQYLEALQEWNPRVRLVADAGEEAITGHIIDSLSIFTSGLIGGEEIVADIGTGAGFPGAPCGIVNPKLRVTLIESARKKTDFLEKLIARLGLDNIRVLNGRAEDLARDQGTRESFDVVLVRAVGGLAEIAELALPLLRKGGSMIAQKGRGEQVAREIEESAKAINMLGGNAPEIFMVNSSFIAGERRLVIVKKTAPTDTRYPRRAGMPRKHPLK